MSKLSVELTLRDIPESPALTAEIEKKFQRLTNHCKKIEFCKLVIEHSTKHSQQGNLYAAHLEVGVPGKVLAVTHKMHEDLYSLIRQAFEAMLHQVDTYVQKRRGEVKNHHMEPLYGKVARLFKDYGFIEGLDGREYYFSANCFLHRPFSELKINTLVRFLENTLDEKLHASHVVMSEDHLMA